MEWQDNSDKISVKVMEENMKRREEMAKRGIIVLNSEVDDNVGEDIVFRLMQMETDRNIDEIRMFIHSPGGNCYDMWAIIAQMEAMKKPIATTAMGWSASAAANILVSGTPGRRSAFRRAHIMVHEVSASATYMKNSQLQLHAEETKRLNEEIKELLRRKTRMTKHQIEKYMSSALDMWMTPEEALQMGVIDNII